MVIGLLVLIGLSATRFMVIPAVALVGIIGWTQIGAPVNDLSAHVPIDVAPYYDRVFRAAGDQSEMQFHEEVWFAKQMDRIDNDASTSFVPLGPVASSIVGVYSPHVVGKLVGEDAESKHLSKLEISLIKAGERPIVAVYGRPVDVANMIATFPSDLGVGTQLLDVTHRGDLGYRLVVFAMPDSTRLPFTWRADAVSVTEGRIANGSVTVDGTDKAGFVTFGPYKYLEPGRYQVTLQYSATADPAKSVGVFDVASPEDPGAASTPIYGTDNSSRDITISFDVSKASRWEFRSLWTGIGALTIDGFTLVSS